MLILSRKKNESIVINDNITVVVVEIRGDKVRLGIEAPKEIPTLRLGYASHDHHSPFYIAALNPDYFRDKGGIYLEEVVPRKEYRLVRDGSVVAREYGIPAIVGVKDALKRIRTGDEITVDGDLGRVVLS